MRIFATLGRNAYYRKRGITPGNVIQASWQKSAFSNLNGNCLEISRLLPDRIGIRDTKDHGTGPVLVFTGPEWEAFLSGVKQGQFDHL